MRLNETDALTDDLVRYQSVKPAKTFSTRLEVHLTNNTDSDPSNDLSGPVEVRLDCPSGRVYFAYNPIGGRKTDAITITLPTNGDYVALYITGEQKSAVADDAVIRAVKPASTVPTVVYGTKNATVFWFDAPKMDVIAGTSPYTFEATQPGNKELKCDNVAISANGEVAVKPSGLTPSAAQFTNLAFAFEQTGVSINLSNLWGYLDFGKGMIKDRHSARCKMVSSTNSLKARPNVHLRFYRCSVLPG